MSRKYKIPLFRSKGSEYSKYSDRFDYKRHWNKNYWWGPDFQSLHCEHSYWRQRGFEKCWFLFFLPCQKSTKYYNQEEHSTTMDFSIRDFSLLQVHQHHQHQSSGPGIKQYFLQRWVQIKYSEPQFNETFQSWILEQRLKIKSAGFWQNCNIWGSKVEQRKGFTFFLQLEKESHSCPSEECVLSSRTQPSESPWPSSMSFRSYWEMWDKRVHDHG